MHPATRFHYEYMSLKHPATILHISIYSEMYRTLPYKCLGNCLTSGYRSPSHSSRHLKQSLPHISDAPEEQNERNILFKGFVLFQISTLRTQISHLKSESELTTYFDKFKITINFSRYALHNFSVQFTFISKIVLNL